MSALLPHRTGVIFCKSVAEIVLVTFRTLTFCHSVSQTESRQNELKQRLHDLGSLAGANHRFRSWLVFTQVCMYFYCYLAKT